MLIEGTELEYTEADEIALEYFLGEGTETKEAWAQRVWNKCKEYKETCGKGYPESGYKKEMPGVYDRAPKELWEEKKRNRRHSFLGEVLGVHVKNQISDLATIQRDLKQKKQPDYLPHLCDAVILEIKKHPRYSTQTERHRKGEKETEQTLLKEQESKLKLLSFYEKQGRSEADIVLTHPELAPAVISKKEAQGKGVKKRGKGA